MDVGNLISDSSASLNPSLYIWKFLAHILLKPSLEDFEHKLASMWNVCVCVSRLVMFNSFRPHRLWPARLLCLWDSPGKNTGEDCHSLLQRNFPIQGLNPSLLHHRQGLYRLSYREVLKGLAVMGFEPMPPKRLEPQSSTLDLSAMSTIIWKSEHSLVSPVFGTGMKTDLFWSCSHC